jgi:hypothetical protein
MDSIALPDITRWSQEFDLSAKPWVLVGKGPTFDQFKNVDTSRYFVCSLNHVVRETPVTVAHFIDIEPVLHCQEILEQNARFVVMPYHPHDKCKVTAKTLSDFAEEIPALKRLAEQGRLIWYNLDSAKPHGSSPVIKARHFSSACALDILARCGASRVFSIGVDGGASYNDRFSDLTGETLLANGHKNFDVQFRDIADVLLNSTVCFSPWGVDAPVKVFVGADEAQMAGVKVLEYSIKKHASISVEVQPIDNKHIPIPQDPANRSRTGFSFARFDIPRLCGYKGRGIYMDADMQVFRDIRELWMWDMKDAAVAHANHTSATGRIPQYSVLLLDCERLQWNVDEIVRGLDERTYDYKGLMHEFCLAPGDEKQALLPEGWNSLEHFDPVETRLIHYTDMNTQPWVSNHNKNGNLWYKCLREAINEGFVSTDFINQEIEAGHISPEILVWAGLPDPNNYAQRKFSWVAPYTRFAKSGVFVERIKARLKKSPVIRRFALQSRFIASLRRVIGV